MHTLTELRIFSVPSDDLKFETTISKSGESELIEDCLEIIFSTPGYKTFQIEINALEQSFNVCTQFDSSQVLFLYNWLGTLIETHKNENGARKIRKGLDDL